jgi:hypothetical protein
MYFKRGPIISRAIDAIANKNIEDFAFLPLQGFVQLLESSKVLEIGAEAQEALQRFLCKKVENKRVWNEGDT